MVADRCNGNRQTRQVAKGHLESAGPVALKDRKERYKRRPRRPIEPRDCVEINVELEIAEIWIISREYLPSSQGEDMTSQTENYSKLQAGLSTKLSISSRNPRNNTVSTVA